MLSSLRIAIRNAHGDHDGGARAERRLEASADAQSNRKAAGSCGTPVPELTRSVGINLNDRLQLRRAFEILSSPQS
jgi:hypothetical protein